MKRGIVLLFCICMAALLDACGETGNGQTSGRRDEEAGTGQSQIEQPDIGKLESGQLDGDNQNTAPSVQMDGSNSSILIAYFTWADNTQVENPDAVDVDATTSASVLPPGNAAKIAGWIQERTAGDLFSVIVEEPYSSDYDECLDRAADEKAEDARPALASHVEDMDQYDTVFIGFPNWWYTVPMAVHSFLEEYDFDGKTVIPFVTHGTGGQASTIQDITADLPDSEILQPIGVYRPEVDNSETAVDAWLESLGF